MVTLLGYRIQVMVRSFKLHSWLHMKSDSTKLEEKKERKKDFFYSNEVQLVLQCVHTYS